MRGERADGSVNDEEVEDDENRKDLDRFKFRIGDVKEPPKKEVHIFSAVSNSRA